MPLNHSSYYFLWQYVSLFWQWVDSTVKFVPISIFIWLSSHPVHLPTRINFHQISTKFRFVHKMHAEKEIWYIIHFDVNHQVIWSNWYGCTFLESWQNPILITAEYRLLSFGFASSVQQRVQLIGTFWLKFSNGGHLEVRLSSSPFYPTIEMKCI